MERFLSSKLEGSCESSNPDAMRDTANSLRDYVESSESGEPDKSEVLRLLLRAGLRAGASDAHDALREAITNRVEV